MITKYFKKDLKQAIEDNDFNYPYSSLLANNLKAIYVLFGWSHMTEDFHRADELIDELTAGVFEGLLKKEEYSLASAGLKIEGWFDEDGLVNLDYYFCLE